MSIQNIQLNAQSSELYQIRKQPQPKNIEQQTEQAQLSSGQQVDEYDTANPVGEEVEGIYSVSYDEEGNLNVNYTQPTRNSEAQSQDSALAGGVQAAGVTEDNSNDDDIDEKIKELEKQRDQIKQQLNKEKNEDVKKSLRVELATIESQIAMLESQKTQ